MSVGRGIKVLVVEDDAASREALADGLAHDFEVVGVPDAFHALACVGELAPDVVLTDLRLPGVDGLELMQRVHAQDPECPVVIVTGSRRIDTAVAAIRGGAADYLGKPLHLDELALVLRRAVEHRRVRGEMRELERRLREQGNVEALIGASAAMEEVRQTILQVAPSRATVLITGESGTGKGRVAQAIHEHSPRAGRRFVKLHCGALAESLLESELFGHERGAFTGAFARRDGRFHDADGGTLFLDEIGEIPLSVQVKLLRVLQERQFERVGGNHTSSVDVRIVAATNRDLLDEIRRGHFREDLYYRLAVVDIHMPPLRGRAADVPMLAMQFLRDKARADDRQVDGFTDEAMERLVAYPWPGNVRELENAIERALVLCSGDRIGVRELPPQLAGRSPDAAPQVPGATLDDIERYTILRTLEHVGGVKAHAARILGITHRTIQNKLRHYAAQGLALEPGPGDDPDDVDDRLRSPDAAPPDDPGARPS